MDQFESVRKNKFQNWISALGEEYSFQKSFDICNFHNTKVGEKISLAGRITKKRDLGQICFGQIMDNSGSCQFSLKKDFTINFDFALKNIDMGDIIGISGETYNTQTGEYTLNVEKIIILSKCFRNPPEKWSGVKDEETKLRQYYYEFYLSLSLNKLLINFLSLMLTCPTLSEYAILILSFFNPCVKCLNFN